MNLLDMLRQYAESLYSTVNKDPAAPTLVRSSYRDPNPVAAKQIGAIAQQLNARMLNDGRANPLGILTPDWDMRDPRRKAAEAYARAQGSASGEAQMLSEDSLAQSAQKSLVDTILAAGSPVDPATGAPQVDFGAVPLTRAGWKLAGRLPISAQRIAQLEGRAANLGAIASDARYRSTQSAKVANTLESVMDELHSTALDAIYQASDNDLYGGAGIAADRASARWARAVMLEKKTLADRAGLQTYDAVPATFHSPLRKVLDDPKIPPKMSQQQALSLLPSPGKAGWAGVKAEEVKWLGIDDYIRGKASTHKFTKTELQKFVDDNQVEIVELTGKGPTPFELDGPVEADFGPNYARASLSTPGGINYREVLFQWGNKPAPKASELSFRDWRDTYFTLGDRGWENAQGNVYTDERMREMYNSAPRLGGDFYSSHFEQPNILAHMRLNDRTTFDGRPSLFVEEIQSDWRTAKAQKRNIFAEFVPDAPLINDYPELAAKRLVRMAADEGKDVIQWTTGKQQAKRYNQLMIDNVRQLDYDTYDMILDITKPDGTHHIIEGVTPPHLRDYVGVDAADKLLKYSSVRSLQGSNIQVGGRGFSDVYDRQLPKAFEKIAKKFGGHVEQGPLEAPTDMYQVISPGGDLIDARWNTARTLDAAKDYAQKLNSMITRPDGREYTIRKVSSAPSKSVWTFHIPEALKKLAKTEGFPLFQFAGPALGLAELARQSSNANSQPQPTQ